MGAEAKDGKRSGGDIMKKKKRPMINRSAGWVNFAFWFFHPKLKREDREIEELTNKAGARE